MQSPQVAWLDMDLLLTPSFLPAFGPRDLLPKVLLHGHMVPGKPSDKPWGAGAEQREVHRAGGQGTGLLLFLALSLED